MEKILLLNQFSKEITNTFVNAKEKPANEIEKSIIAIYSSMTGRSATGMP